MKTEPNGNRDFFGWFGLALVLGLVGLFLGAYLWIKYATDVP